MNSQSEEQIKEQIKQRAKALVAEMSLEEKFGQIVCLWPKPETKPEDTKEMYPQGAGVISATNGRVLKDPGSLADFQRKWQQETMERSPHHIPAIFHIEGLCGTLIPKAVSFPTGIGRASGWNPEQEKRIGEIVARQSRALGISHVLAPVLDISRDSRNGRQGETYGEDPTLAAVLGAAYTEGIQNPAEEGIQTEAVAKHFLGFHGSTGGIQSAHFETGERQLREIYAKPFQAAISQSGLRGVMPCYSAVNGMFPSVSQMLLTDLLRDEMGFDGLVVSDYNALSGIYNGGMLFETKAEVGEASIKAGMDVEMPVRDCFGEELKEQFEAGKIPMGALDRTVERILEAKIRMGLFEHPYALQGEQLQKAFENETDREISLQSARESLVLLKNEGVLPLAENPGKMAVIGPHAETARALFGGYTHFSMTEGSLVKQRELDQISRGEKPEAYPGSKVLRGEHPEYEEQFHHLMPECKSLLEMMQERFGAEHVTYAKGYDVAGTDKAGFEEALDIARNADIVILTLGGKYGTRRTATMAEGVDAVDINLPEIQEAFLEQLEKLGKKTIGIHLDGRPISSDRADRVLDAILEAWSPSEMGAPAILDVLTGIYNPSGKLPVSVAYSAGQIPVYYNMPNASGFLQAGSIGFQDYVDCPHRARYPFGYGLSYTSFEYQDMKVEPKNTYAEITFTVENTGSVSGTEVVQLYFSDLRASYLRPGRELAGFRRVPLLPGEKKKVAFKLYYSQTAFLDERMQWKIEAGEFRVMAGASSEDIRLAGDFRIEESSFIDGKNRAFWA